MWASTDEWGGDVLIMVYVVNGALTRSTGSWMCDHRVRANRIAPVGRSHAPNSPFHRKPSTGRYTELANIVNWHKEMLANKHAVTRNLHLWSKCRQILIFHASENYLNAVVELKFSWNYEFRRRGESLEKFSFFCSDQGLIDKKLNLSRVHTMWKRFGYFCTN